MTSVEDAFREFRSRLETSESEDAAASRRQRKLRFQLDDAFDIAEDFLTGSYRRHTKTKPLRDVDIMIVLRDVSYLAAHPGQVLQEIRKALTAYYGQTRVCTDRRAVRVDFGVTRVGDMTGEVISFDVVPAFAEGDHYLIPDDKLGKWIPTNPKIHAELATLANKNFDGQWKPLVKMIKKWNAVNGAPVEPSFLLEVMAMQLITGSWTGSHAYELRDFFASAADRVDEGWPDPAHVGPDISDVLDEDPGKMRAARLALGAAEAACTRAIMLERRGRNGEAVTGWRSVFGELFPAP